MPESTNQIRFSLSILAVTAMITLLCAAHNAKAVPATAQNDAITELILKDASTEPRTPLAFLQMLKKSGLKVKYHIVSNGGIQNVSRGSFSCFGTVSGKLGDKTLQDQDLSFGIFIEPDARGNLAVQNDFHTKLLVEVIAKDFSTGVKNFWELIGDGKTADWHFRTDSFGISSDVARVNMELNPSISKDSPLFGNTSRCSGCHLHGDMLMKELSLPHNDWLQPGVNSVNAAIGKYKLKAGPNSNDPEMVAASMFAEAVSPEDLAQTVRKSLVESIKTQWESPACKESDKQKLRAVLAPLEMNIESDAKAFNERLANKEAIEIPSTFFFDELLTGTEQPIKIAPTEYLQALKSLGSSFAADETTGLVETDHAFLFPVRSYADSRAIDYLLDKGKLNPETVFAMLSVDASVPIYSKQRLELMQYVPDSFKDSSELKESMIRSIEAIPSEQRSAAASDILTKFKSNTRNLAYINQQSSFELGHDRRKARLEGQKSADFWIKIANERRKDIQRAQSSQNPRGTILEGGLGAGGFRRIFPEYSKLAQP
ncbi:MAG: hypothetical protein K2X81_22405 [Candidatus Obscuribacterales bacterium]|nr:hypothetical protein [Candidatus Obscuribacterales bacterium]